MAPNKTKNQQRHDNKKNRNQQLLPVTNAPSASKATTSNRPKNHFILDASVPFEFTFQRYGSSVSIIVQQTPAEELWPGGALWDLGVLLSQLLVHATKGATCLHANKSSGSGGIERIFKSIPPIVNWKDMTVLELGCGIGLTGLVAAALGARTVVLTDLVHVIDGITLSNAKLNAFSNNRVMAVPLCWGNAQDEELVLKLLKENKNISKSRKPKRKSKGTQENEQDDDDGFFLPDLILIGDVAYQHKPDAPSHFDPLLSTLLKFVGNKTLVVFGTRMRMPASMDLLQMFQTELQEVVVPPLQAHEVDPTTFAKLGLEKNQKHPAKHNMTIHFLKKKQS